MSSFVINNTDWAEDLQQGLSEYMMTLFNSIDEDVDVDTLSGQPFCGCDVCEYREILSYVTPIIINGYNDKKVDLSV
jgi:hypothetical protein